MLIIVAKNTYLKLLRLRLDVLELAHVKSKTQACEVTLEASRFAIRINIA